ncbi:S4 domain-containing protein YaaA [Erysipelotrichaceae bacterium OttesenSCG-928-M19]|nr:S4 domain-containing protein YaaA [Erysipelotrichaceae bacterium OttesenSCG-928-M19]
MEIISIESEYITLAQFLKLTNYVSSGGQAKFFLMENDVIINGKLDRRRGLKLYDDDVILLADSEYKITCI